jgi:putative SOS response-associated peptidase YedK
MAAGCCARRGRRRSTYKLTWEEIVRLYRLTLDQPARNTQARYNVCPTTTIDTVVENDGKRELVPMRWGLIPSWWSKPLKELHRSPNCYAYRKPALPTKSTWSARGELGVTHEH